MRALKLPTLKDWAIRGVVPSTLRDHGAQRALETFQCIDLPMDVSVPIASEPKKRAHVLKGEIQFACPSDEDQAPLTFFGVEPVPARAAGRLRQNTNAFVVPDGLDIYPGLLGQRANGH